MDMMLDTLVAKDVKYFISKIILGRIKFEKVRIENKKVKTYENLITLELFFKPIITVVATKLIQNDFD